MPGTLAAVGLRARGAAGRYRWSVAKQRVRVLISGASVAGPMAAYWLARYGFAVTVVERMPRARVRTSGHAVDLFGPAMDVAEWAGGLPRGNGCPHPDRHRLVPARKRSQCRRR